MICKISLLLLVVGFLSFEVSLHDAEVYTLEDEDEDDGSGSGSGSEEDIVDIITSPVPTSSGKTVPTMSHNYRGVNSILCGLKTGSSRIVGGRKSARGSWPWLLGLVHHTSTDHVICGATLISEKYVMTAAHCFSRDESLSPQDFYVRLGEHQLFDDEGSEKLARVSKIVRHQHYLPGVEDNDIAILEMERPVSYSRFVRPLCVPNDTMQDSQLDTKQCVIAGWGRVEEDGELSGVVREAKVPLVKRKICRKTHPSITESMICAGHKDGNIDSCEGDSGGPLACFSPKARRYYLIGVVSWGEGCARKGNYGIYANVRKFKPWIDANVRQ